MNDIRAHTSIKVHRRRITADLSDTQDSHLAMSPMAIAIAMTFYTTEWDHLPYGCCERFQQRLCNNTTMITDMLRLLMDRVHHMEQQSQIVSQLRMGSIMTPKVLKWLAVTIRNYHCQLSSFAPDWTTESDCCEQREPSAPTDSISSNIRQ